MQRRTYPASTISCLVHQSQYLFASYLLFLLMMILPQAANAIKCHGCQFSLSRCENPLDCYNQPDFCSNINFSPILTQTLECEFGCEQFVVTDATGSIIHWQRGCASQNSPRSSYICSSKIIAFFRHEQCWCHTDYCNSSNQLVPLNIKFLLFVTLLMTLILSRL